MQENVDIREDESVRHSRKELTVCFVLNISYLELKRSSFLARNIDLPDLPSLLIESRPSSGYPEQVMRP